MGADMSRDMDLPENIDLMYERCKSYWKTEKYLQEIGNSVYNSTPTLSPHTLKCVGQIIWIFMKTREIKLNILEVMAGNGVASKIIYDTINKLDKKTNPEIGLESWKSTELQNFSSHDSVFQVEYDIDSVDAIKKYCSDYDTLLMVSPPPSGLGGFDEQDGHEHDTKQSGDLAESNEFTNGYADYFAIREWTAVENSKYIIIVGELGASDGSKGMYKYMLRNPIWRLYMRQQVYCGNDMFGGSVEKEVFIFERA